MGAGWVGRGIEGQREGVGLELTLEQNSCVNMECSQSSVSLLESSTESVSLLHTHVHTVPSRRRLRRGMSSATGCPHLVFTKETKAQG
jgi:hypothetical protein